jgi:aspartate racemase
MMLGILAGMGPRSTAPFIERVLDECVAQYGAILDEDFPPMMIHTIPTPFRARQPLDHEGMYTAIRAGLERLAATGVGLIAIPCNTAHLYFDDLVEGLGVPVLHIAEVTIAALPPGTRSVAVLGTRATVESGLYQTGLRERGISSPQIVGQQSAVDAIIDGVKTGWSPERLIHAWDELTGALAARGIDTVILGCTELAAVPDTDREERVRIVDSSRALAAELVRNWREEHAEREDGGNG